MTLLEFLDINHFLSCIYPSGFLVHGLVALASLALFIWWTKKDALMSFRAWALFMTIVHAFYFLITCDHIRNCIGMKMADIYFIHGLEAAVTLVTVLRLYFIIEAYDIDISNNSVDVNPVQRLTSSVKRAITIPIEPRKINGNMKKPRKKAKTLKEKLRKLLF